MIVPTSKIIANPKNNISRDEENCMNPSQCEGLAQTIERVGLLHPVIVKERGEMFELVAGFRRYTAVAIVLGRTDIEVKVVPPDASAEEINAIENLHQQEQSFWEEMCMLRKMFDHDAKMVDIQKALGKTKTWVNVRWKAWNLPEEVKGQIQAGLLGFSHVRMLLQKGVEAEQAAQKMLSGIAAGQSAKSMQKDVINRRNLRGKKTIQQTMTKCLNMQAMQAVQALRYAIGEIEEKTLINWINDHK